MSLGLMSAGEGGEIVGDEFLYRRRLLAADSFDQVVVAREDSVLVVDGELLGVVPRTRENPGL